MMKAKKFLISLLMASFFISIFSMHAQPASAATYEPSCVNYCVGGTLPLVIVSDTSTLANGVQSVATYNGNAAWTANIAGATWIWTEYFVSDPAHDAYANFTKTFTIPSNAVSLSGFVTIAADNSYWCSLNGNPVGQNESIYNFLDQNKRTYSLAGLHTGTNTFSCTVKNLGDPGLDKYHNPAGLLYRMEINGACLTVCGNNVVEPGESCELPGTSNNAYCPQSTTSGCLGSKLGVRDAFGNCNSGCGCKYDSFNYVCTKGQCGATCAADSDCNNYCSGNFRHFSGVCRSCLDCSCSYSTENCDSKDGWYGTSQYQWISAGECTKKEQVKKEYRDYSCAPDACAYVVTNQTWQDTGHTMNKDNGTECNDGLYCTNPDTCTAGVCGGPSRICSQYNLPPIQTCLNVPDGNSFTWDYAPGFTSVCDEANDLCTTGSQTLTHACSKQDCQAQCEVDADCSDGNSFTIDSCLGDCSCDHVCNGVTYDSAAQITNNNADDNSPMGLKAQNGDLYIVYQHWDGTSPPASIYDGVDWDLYILHSDDNGITWSSQPVANKTGDDVQPYIIQDAQGTFIIVYETSSEPTHGVYMLTSPDGIVWSEPRLVAVPKYALGDPTIVQGPDGAYYVAYEDYAANESKTSIFIKNSTNLVDWSNPIRITYVPYSALDPNIIFYNGVFYFSWSGGDIKQNLYLSQTTNPLDAAGWASAAVRVTESDTHDFEPNLFRTCNKLYLLFNRWNNTGDTNQQRNNLEIYLGTLADGSSIWSFEQLTDNPVRDDYPSFFRGSFDPDKMAFARFTCNNTEIMIMHLDLIGCQLPECGNGVIETGEECDDGNTDNNDGCSSECKTERCGDGMVNMLEDCEFPGTLDNTFCTQSTSDCQGFKLGVRNLYGNCNGACGCAPDNFQYSCVKGQCGAACDSNDDCQNECIGNVFHSGGQCDQAGCSCSYAAQQDCTALNHYDDYVQYCDGDAVMRHRLYHYYTCDARDGCKENTEWSDNELVSDCNGLDRDYCDGNGLKHDNGYCFEGACKVENTVIKDCYYEKDYCDFNKIISETGFCNLDTASCDKSVVEIEDCSGNDYEDCQDTYYKHSYTESCQKTDEGLTCVPAPSLVDCRDDLWCNGQETCSETDGMHCESGAAVDCADSNECTNDNCAELGGNNGYCDNSNKPYGTWCGLERDCQDDHCIDPYWYSYPADGHDYCSGGVCTEYMCDSTGNKCDTKCGAQCDGQTPCPDSKCSVTYDDSCDGLKLVEYNSNKILDSTTVSDSCQNTCQPDCECTDCSVDCSAPPTNNYCVKDVCGAQCGKDSDCNDGDPNTLDWCLEDCTCKHEYQPSCGNGVVDKDANPPEQCELPGTLNNIYCVQTTTSECQGFKLGVRDAFGDCNAGCGCAYDPFVYSCVKGQCGALCDSNDDCQNYCSGNFRYYNGVCRTCSTCSCSYSYENCDSKDGWYNNVEYRWMPAGDCMEKQQVKKEYRDYSCAPEACTYAVTSDAWTDTGQTRTVQDGTGCDDGFFCTVNDQCTAGVCSSGQPRECSDGNECTDETCSEESDSCVIVTDDTNVCGSAQNCPDSYCNGINWTTFPKDGHDYCSAGECMSYSCAQTGSEYSVLCDSNADGDGDGVPNSQDACPSVFGQDCNGCPNPCTGCANMVCGSGQPTCEANNSKCSATQCPADGCGLGGCASSQLADYPASVDNTCSLEGNLGTCTQNTCTPACVASESCQSSQPLVTFTSGGGGGGSTGFCGDGLLKKWTGEECEKDSDCTLGMLCNKSSCKCVVSCTEDWSCSDWGACSVDGIQTRICTDKNNCSTTKSKPSESQSCSSNGAGSLEVTHLSEIKCGDAKCDSGETCETCPQDCGECTGAGATTAGGFDLVGFMTGAPGISLLGLLVIAIVLLALYLTTRKKKEKK